jgi:predicted nucleic acid-binding protein
VAERDAGAFVADTAPIIYRLSRGPDRQFVAACDPLFDAVEDERIGCLVSAASVSELFVEPFRAGPGAVAAVDAFLRQPGLGVAELDAETARIAAALLASGRLNRLPAALVAATALRYELPLVTGDRRLARGLGSVALLVSDFR